MVNDQESYVRSKKKEETDEEEELHFTDIRSKRSQQYPKRERFPSRGRRDNSTPATQVRKRN